MNEDKPKNKESHLKRRSLLKHSLLLSSGIFTQKIFAKQASLDPNRVIGNPSLDQAYGKISDPSLFRSLVPGDQFNARSVSPLSKLVGAITPSGLHFERHHAGIPQIMPDKHKLLLQGKRGLTKILNMQEIKRYPQRTIPAFIECSGNSSDNWKDEPVLNTVDMLHGMSSQSFWTGVPMSYLLEAINAPKEGAWIIAEGNDAASLARSIPIEKCWKDGLLAYGQNGEPVRAEQGYPLRLLLPGWEGGTGPILLTN
ncbi:MAG: molybdopterin-dependent oxidoreductase [Oligoflexales bacterium]|nr:molybdopterin-dependent oxidoreductase [Oligoflexales bacterium]